MNLRSALITFPLATFACLASAATDEVKLIATDDAQMQAAKATARRTLDQFLAIHDKPPFDATNMEVKVVFSHQGYDELMWVAPFRRTTSGFQGILKNQPRDIPGLQWGQQVTFTKAEIVDWGYAQRGKTYGHFTTCVLFERQPSPEVSAARRDRGYVCDRSGSQIRPVKQ